MSASRTMILNTPSLALGLALAVFVPQQASAQSKPTSKPATPDKKTPAKKTPKKKKVSKRDKELAVRKIRMAANSVSVNAKKSETLALEALKLYPDYEQARSFLGWLYNVKLGENEKALEQYEYLIRNSKNKKVKADALANKGSLIFITKRDGETAIELYKAAYSVYRVWDYADKAANLCFHIEKVKRSMHNAKLAEKSILRLASKLKKKVDATNGTQKEEYEKRLEQLQTNIVKVKLQLATCHLYMGDKAAAAKVITGNEEFPRAVKYNLALYRAVRGEKQGVVNSLSDFMLTRKTAKARNLLRVFIREEPVFKRYLEGKAFKKLITDEKEKDDKKEDAKKEEKKDAKKGK
ncbi:MAG: hypothetical protein P1V97_16300 [Planctomycetota bacterium]|nr:hypothetical protein [Planctomycetota bacterium]